MAQKQNSRSFGMNRKNQEMKTRGVGYSVTWLSPGKLRLDIPSLSQEFFERGQRYLPFHLAKLFDFCTVYWPLYTADPDERVMVYLLNFHIEISQSLYTKTTPKFPLYLDSSIANLKSSSRCVKSELCHPDMTSHYAVYQSVDVCIDPETNRPKAIPDWWKRKHGPSEQDVRQSLRVTFPVKPSHCLFGAERKIVFSDIDANRHTNFSAYIRLCLDTFYEIIQNNRHANAYRVFLTGRVKGIWFLFKGDSKLGDMLRVEFWEDVTSENGFCFEISKGSRIIINAKITFYRTLVDSNL